MSRTCKSTRVLFAAMIFSLIALTPLSAQVLDEDIEKALDLKAYDLQELMLPSGSPGDFVAFVRLGTDEYVLQLERHSLRGDNFQLLVEDESGEIVRQDAAAPRTYRGTALGFINGEVSATLNDGHLTAMVALEDGTDWWIQSVAEELEGAQLGIHAVYQLTDVQIDEEYKCGLDLLGDQPTKHDHDEQTETLLTGNKVCEVAFDADVEFYNKNGSSVSNTLVDIERVMNTVEFIYERDCDITYELTTLVVRTQESDPYSSSNPSTLLNQFRSHWNNNFNWVLADTHHLMTGKNIDGGVIGIAYLSVICSGNNAFGLSESKFTGNFSQRVALTAHELGHNWSADHCNGNGDCHIMCSGLGGCNGLGSPNFGVPTANGIKNYSNSRGCLINEQDPATLPLADDFSGFVIDPVKWTWTQGGQINTNGVNEPSGTTSLNLDAANSSAYRDDEIRSGFIDLLGKGGTFLSYYAQHRGVSNGDDLVVEYWEGAGGFEWVEIDRLTSDGVDETSYTFREVALPFLAFHSEFRLRFRTEVDGGSEDWYVDNVLLRQPPALVEITPPSPGQTATAEVRNLIPGESASLIYNVTGTGAPTCLFGGTLCIDLLAPFFNFPVSVPADANGTATFNVPVPASAPVGLNLWFQGIALRNPSKLSDSSNVLATQIQ